ncbi:MAG: hypothetical protein QXQ79_01625 [Candidatus Nanoarchaeia archaeon]
MIAHSNIANIYINKTTDKKTYLKKAEIHADLALELDNAYWFSNFVKGRICLERQKLESALKYFKIALKTSNDPKLLNDIGFVYLSKEELDFAIEYFNQAIKFKKKFTRAYFNRGKAWLQKALKEQNLESKKQYLNNAHNDFNKILTSQTTDNLKGKIYFSLALYYRSSGNLNTAINYIKEAILCDHQTNVKYSRILNKLEKIIKQN